MLDFVISRFAMIVAALLILVAGIGLWQMQRSAMEDEELQNIADKIAKTVNELSAMNVNTRVNMSFNTTWGGIYLKPTVGGDSYTLKFYRNLLFLSQGGRSLSSNFMRPVHLWKPEKGEYTSTEMDALDESNKLFEFKSGEKLIFIERKKLVDYETFIYFS